MSLGNKLPAFCLTSCNAEDVLGEQPQEIQPPNKRGVSGVKAVARDTGAGGGGRMREVDQAT